MDKIGLRRRSSLDEMQDFMNSPGMHVSLARALLLPDFANPKKGSNFHSLSMNLEFPLFVTYLSLYDRMNGFTAIKGSVSEAELDRMVKEESPVQRELSELNGRMKKINSVLASAPIRSALFFIYGLPNEKGEERLLGERLGEMNFNLLSECSENILKEIKEISKITRKMEFSQSNAFAKKAFGISIEEFVSIMEIEVERMNKEFSGLRAEVSKDLERKEKTPKEIDLYVQEWFFSASTKLFAQKTEEEVEKKRLLSETVSNAQKDFLSETKNLSQPFGGLESFSPKPRG